MGAWPHARQFVLHLRHPRSLASPSAPPLHVRACSTACQTSEIASHLRPHSASLRTLLNQAQALQGTYSPIRLSSEIPSPPCALPRHIGAVAAGDPPHTV